MHIPLTGTVRVQGIEQPCPVPLNRTARDGPITRRAMLGGILPAEYRRAAELLAASDGFFARYGCSHYIGSAACAAVPLRIT